jgi:hypothetical protein
MLSHTILETVILACRVFSLPRTAALLGKMSGEGLSEMSLVICENRLSQRGAFKFLHVERQSTVLSIVRLKPRLIFPLR